MVMERGGEEADDEANHHPRKPVDRINQKAARARAAAAAAATTAAAAGAGSTTREFIRIV